MTCRTMLVEDDAFQRAALQRALRQQFARERMVVEAFADPLQARARAHVCEFDVVIADYRLPFMNGVAFLRELRDLQPAATRLMLTASADIETAVAALNKAEVFRFIRKPWDHALRATVGEALVHSRAARRSSPRLSESPQERALRELEESEPGITRVRWGPDGSVLLD